MKTLKTADQFEAELDSQYQKLGYPSRDTIIEILAALRATETPQIAPCADACEAIAPIQKKQTKNVGRLVPAKKAKKPVK